MTNNASPFWEYQYVLKHSEKLPLLQQLHEVRLDQDQARRLVKTLCAKTGLTMPVLRFAGWTDRGNYEHGVIRLRSADIPADLLVHELAHHWVFTKMTGKPDSVHGFDFTSRLDKLAVEAICNL